MFHFISARSLTRSLAHLNRSNILPRTVAVAVHIPNQTSELLVPGLHLAAKSGALLPEIFNLVSVLVIEGVFGALHSFRLLVLEDGQFRPPAFGLLRRLVAPPLCTG